MALAGVTASGATSSAIGAVGAVAAGATGAATGVGAAATGAAAAAGASTRAGAGTAASFSPTVITSSVSPTGVTSYGTFCARSSTTRVTSGVRLFSATRTRATPCLLTASDDGTRETTPGRSMTTRGGGSAESSTDRGTRRPLPRRRMRVRPSTDSDTTDTSAVAGATVATAGAGAAAGAAPATSMGSDEDGSKATMISRWRLVTRATRGSESRTRTRATSAPSLAVVASNATSATGPPAGAARVVTAASARAWRRSTSTVRGSGCVAAYDTGADDSITTEGRCASIRDRTSSTCATGTAARVVMPAAKATPTNATSGRIAERANIYLPSSVGRSGLRISRCLTSDSGSLTCCTKTIASASTAFTFASYNFSPPRTRYVLPSGACTIPR